MTSKDTGLSAVERGRNLQHADGMFTEAIHAMARSEENLRLRLFGALREVRGVRAEDLPDEPRREMSAFWKRIGWKRGAALTRAKVKLARSKLALVSDLEPTVAQRMAVAEVALTSAPDAEIRELARLFCDLHGSVAGAVRRLLREQHRQPSKKRAPLRTLEEELSTDPSKEEE
jgi:hypothetical protein